MQDGPRTPASRSCSSWSSSGMPVFWGHPASGRSAMLMLSTRSLALATDAPTSPVANATTAVSSSTRAAVRRMRRRRWRCRACSRYSTRPAERFSSGGCRSRCFMLDPPFSPAAAVHAGSYFRLLFQAVLHTVQKQTLCRQGRPRLPTVAAGQDRGDPGRVQPACPCLTQSPCQDAHHIV